VIRVSIDVSAVPAEPVGAGRYTIDLVAALARRPDVALELWSRRRDDQRWSAMSRLGPTPVGVRSVAPRRRPLRLAWEQLRLPSLLAKGDSEVHHGPHYTMPERARLPMVVTVHDLTFLDHPEWHERSKVPVFRRAIRRAADRADALVCVSERTAELLQERVRPHGRVFVVPHGVDHERFRPEESVSGSDERVLARLGVTSPYVLFVGTIEPRKAVPELVGAYSRLVCGGASRHGRFGELSLVLAGGAGWGADDLPGVIASSGVEAKVARLGYVDDEAVPALLRRAAVVAYPAREEGFGLPALEALACGAPLVTTEGTAMAEMAGDAALLVPPGDIDALAEALADALEATPRAATQAEARRTLGLQAAARHTWERSAAGHLEAYTWARRHGAGADSDPSGHGR